MKSSLSDKTKMRRLAVLVGACSSMFCGTLTTRPAIAQTPGAQTASVGLDAFSEETVMTELANRGLNTLLKRVFEVDKVSQDQQDSVLVLSQVRRLIGEPNLSPRERQDIVRKLAFNADKMLSSQKDPIRIMQVAGAMILYGVEPYINTMEYWGENAKTQSEVRPNVEIVVKLLQKCATEADAIANRMADKMGPNPDSALTKQWADMDNLATNAKYTLYMTEYYRALSMDRADAERNKIAQKAFDSLKAFDDSESGLQPVVRNRRAKLLMVKGDYAKAKAMFEEVATNSKGDIKPAPDVSQQYEACYFSALCDLLNKDVPQTQSKLTALLAWQKANLPQDATTQNGVKAAAAMMQYRLYSLQAELASSESEKSSANAKAKGVLETLAAEIPQLRSVIYSQLVNRLDDDADLTKLDPLMLRALAQKGAVEQVKPEGEPFDKKMVERAVEATREIICRKGQSAVDASLVDEAAILLPQLLAKLGRDADAATAYLDYIEKYHGNPQNMAGALDNAMASIARLRNQNASDPMVGKLIDRVLPIAIAPPFSRKEFAFECAQRLQRAGKYAEAAKYYQMVPKEDRRYLSAQFFQMVALRQQLDSADSKLNKAERETLMATIQQLAGQVAAQSQAAIKSAATDSERTRYRAFNANATLMAATMSRQANPARALQLLDSIEEAIKGLPGEDDLLSEALFLRVQSYMQLGQNTQATSALLELLKTKAGDQGANIIFGLLQKLDKDLEIARREKDTDQIRRLLQARAGLSGPLVTWAKDNSNPQIKKYTYRYMVFDAETKRQAALAAETPAERIAGLKQSLALYQQLLTQGDPNNPETVILFNIALTQYDLANYKAAQEGLSSLLLNRKLGPVWKITVRDGQEQAVENEQYWEATYKVYRCNIEMAKEPSSPKQLLEETKSGLKLLFIREGQNVGGKKFGKDFEELRKQLIPEFSVPDISTTEPTTQEAGQ